MPNFSGIANTQILHRAHAHLRKFALNSNLLSAAAGREKAVPIGRLSIFEWKKYVPKKETTKLVTEHYIWGGDFKGKKFN
ncbi:unnamed protein product [Cylicocyclus nassatus]|uniref:Uncharacterized protein n=1 Tax=Cylicocyclus nassatus TaxID=53992 RepID=A0AA36GQY8_CYLNA|nr:unnamed protein product [Cylicocyclus nassatus]